MTTEERYAEGGRIADEIEVELKKINWWDYEPLDPEAYNFERPFGADRMSFGQWIQFILLVRIRDIVATQGNFPPSSNLAAYAVRDMDGVDEADDLNKLLQQLDDLINSQA